LKKKAKKSKISVKGIVLSKGFYITLATMIIVFGTAAVVRKLTEGVVVNKASFDETAWTDVVENAKTDMEETIATEDAIVVEEIEYNPPSAQELLPVMTEPTTPVNKEMSFEEVIKSLDMKMPVEGEIIRDHSPDKHVYFEKMNSWRTHDGIDISAEENTIVKAAAKGVVEKVYEDNKLGIVVEIGHDGGIKTRYANLADINYIEVGRKVAQGDTVGSVGTSSLVEGKEPSHIHFEILKKDESQNPAEFIMK